MVGSRTKIKITIHTNPSCTSKMKGNGTFRGRKGIFDGLKYNKRKMSMRILCSTIKYFSHSPKHRWALQRLIIQLCSIRRVQIKQRPKGVQIFHDICARLF